MSPPLYIGRRSLCFRACPPCHLSPFLFHPHQSVPCGPLYSVLGLSSCLRRPFLRFSVEAKQKFHKHSVQQCYKCRKIYSLKITSVHLFNEHKKIIWDTDATIYSRALSIDVMFLDKCRTFLKAHGSIKILRNLAWRFLMHKLKNGQVDEYE